MGSKFKKIIISFILTLALVICGVSVVALADETGNGFKYTSANNTLEITSDEAMIDYTEGNVTGCPWYSYKGAIKKIIIDDGVTKIGSFCFTNEDNLVDVDIPDSVESIGEAAFAGCNNLKSLNISDNVSNIGKYAFGYNGKMEITNDFVCYCSKDSVAQDFCFKSYVPFESPFTGGKQTAYIKDTSGKQQVWSFVPSADGIIHFYSNCKFDTIGAIYDAETYSYNDVFSIMASTAIASNDDDGSDLNFGINVRLTAGKRYYLATRFATSTKTGSFDVYMNFECDEGYFEEQYCTATCTTDGVRYSVCDFCGSEKYEDVKAFGHNYIEDENVEPTCIDDGYISYSCIRCVDSYVDILEALGHEFIIDHEDATCTEDGYTITTCSRCDYHEEEIFDALGHDYIIDHEDATCTEDGYTITTCSRCDYHTEETIDALGHDYIIDHKDATCTEDGYTITTCSRCDYRNEQTIKSDGHSLKIEFTEPTCTDYGYIITTCNNCDYKTTEFINKLGHDYVVEEIEATCTEDGYTITTCSRCDYRNEQKHYRLGHKIAEILVEATCTETGIQQFKCERCGYVWFEYIIPANGHSMISTIIQPTCTEFGQYYAHCEHCDYEYSYEISPLGHNYIIDRLELNENNINSIVVFKCINCMDEYTKDFNKHINRREQSELDINDDGIINAKDYAILLQMLSQQH